MHLLNSNNTARRALLLVVVLSSCTNGLPMPGNILGFLGLGNILRPLQGTIVAPSPPISSAGVVTASTQGPDPAVSVVTQTVVEIVFETPSFSQYPNGGPRVVYMGGKEGEMPMPTLQSEPAFDIVAPLLSAINDPLGIIQGPGAQQTLPGTEVVPMNGQATPTGDSQNPQSTDNDIHSKTLSGTVVAAYYADWAAKQLAPEDVDFSRFNWVDFAFAVPDENFELTFTETNSEELLHRLVAAAHAQGRNVKLSVGGWTGSAHFSRAVRSSSNRSKLCQSISSAYSRFNLDGIDIDWEYPNGTGAGNEKSENDSANFLKFLKLLRKELGLDARITAATQVVPFAGKDGQPLSDVSDFASVLDWILIMNYDVWGSSPTPGPNTPLSNGCSNSSQPLANAESAIRSWTNAGFPARQIVLGVPAYGYLSRSHADRLATRSENSTTWTSSIAETAVELQSDDGGGDGGQIQFAGLVRQRALVRNAQGDGGEYDGGGGFERLWDSCSSTPWLRSATAQQIVTYDDPESMRLKGELCRRSGILGINLFAVHGDDGHALVDGVRRGLGLL